MPSLSRHAVASAVAAFAASLAGADVVVGWSIPTALPVGPPPIGTDYVYGAADSGANAAGSSLRGQHAAAATAWTSPAGNGSQYSLSSNNWAIGDFYEIRFSALGYQDLFLSWDQTRSSTGPVNFELIMSIDGGANFTTLIESYPVLQSGGGGAPGTWSTSTYNPIYSYVVDLGINPAINADGQTDVMIRFRNLSVPGGSSGSGRIDNIVVTGVVPAPGAVALLGLAGLASRRRRR
jgi:MYXO-CTERM domain-containing protein